MKVIKVHMHEADIEVLDRHAENKSVPRAQLIRDLIKARYNSDKATPEKLNRLISDAYHQSNLPRSEVERLVYFVFARLMG